VPLPRLVAYFVLFVGGAVAGNTVAGGATEAKGVDI
jgi:hypothetical protein